MTVSLRQRFSVTVTADRVTVVYSDTVTVYAIPNWSLSL